MKKQFYKALFVIVCASMALFGTGCASVVSGKTQSVTFQSRPDGADVYVNGLKVGETPVVSQVRRAPSPIVTFKKAGYDDSTIQLQTELNPWFWGNILWPYVFPIASTVDCTTDATIEYEPNTYFATLSSKDGSLPMVGDTDKSSALFRFVLINYKNISSDLSNDKGNYLDAMLDMTKVPTDSRDSAIEKLKQLFMDNSTSVDFANAVEAEFKQK